MSIVNYFYNMSSTFGDTVLKVFEVLGTEYFFFIIFLLTYWMYDKSYAFRMGGVYLSSVLVNFSIKNIVRRQRPYPLEHDSFSMPSGHCQSYSVVVSSSVIYENYHKKLRLWQWIVYPILLVLVGGVIAIDRMYFGRHFLSDCIVGLALGVVCAVCFDKLVAYIASKSKLSLFKFLLIMLPIPVVLYFVATFSGLFSLESVMRIYTCVGAYIGVFFGYWLDSKFLKYKASGSTKNMIFKVIVGVLIMMLAYFILIKTITIVYLIPLNFAILGFLGTYVVPLTMVKAFDENAQNAGGEQC